MARSCSRPAGQREPADADEASAFELVFSGNPALFAIVRLSLSVSLGATLLAALLAAPLGAFLALNRFPGRQVAIVALNSLMGLPPVVVGLAIYLLLSRSGPLGSWGLLFTPKAMLITQTILVLPIIAALARQTIEDLWLEYRDEFAAMNIGPVRRVRTLLWDARFSLVTALLAGFGRAAAEVGSIIIVGGNIEGFTRTMTTTIALETSKGNLPLAMGLGLVLLCVVLLVKVAPRPSNSLAHGSSAEVTAPDASDLPILLDTVHVMCRALRSCAASR